ncbi:hypothetical protein RIF29_33693 [Crotalaria pallida]|uniref:Uncharacterized protein n=1 Tax=Crotalaria pallida TaxID=3830 RepID=A0AAN9E8K4_CROPI
MALAHLLGMVVDGVGEFVSTIWGLQERRWAYTVDVVTSAAVSVTMSFVLCLLSIRNHHHRQRGRGGGMVFASL